MVAFNAGDYHGVKAVTQGQRCAVAMWYTHSPEFTEVSRLHAYRRLAMLYSKQRYSNVSDEASLSVSEKEIERNTNEETKVEETVHESKSDFDDTANEEKPAERENNKENPSETSGKDNSIGVEPKLTISDGSLDEEGIEDFRDEL